MINKLHEQAERHAREPTTLTLDLQRLVDRFDMSARDISLNWQQLGSTEWSVNVTTRYGGMRAGLRARTEIEVVSGGYAAGAELVARLRSRGVKPDDDATERWRFAYEGRVLG